MRRVVGLLPDFEGHMQSREAGLEEDLLYKVRRAHNISLPRRAL